MNVEFHSDDHELRFDVWAMPISFGIQVITLFHRYLSWIKGVGVPRGSPKTGEKGRMSGQMKGEFGEEKNICLSSQVAFNRNVASAKSYNNNINEYSVEYNVMSLEVSDIHRTRNILGL